MSEKITKKKGKNRKIEGLCGSASKHVTTFGMILAAVCSQESECQKRVV